MEERGLVVDSLLRSLHRTNPKIDEKWIKVAKRRFAELESRSVEMIPGQQVFDEIWKRFDE